MKTPPDKNEKKFIRKRDQLIDIRRNIKKMFGSIGEDKKVLTSDQQTKKALAGKEKLIMDTMKNFKKNIQVRLADPSQTNLPARIKNNPDLISAIRRKIINPGGTKISTLVSLLEEGRTTRKGRNCSPRRAATTLPQLTVQVHNSDLDMFKESQLMSPTKSILSHAQTTVLDHPSKERTMDSLLSQPTIGSMLASKLRLRNNMKSSYIDKTNEGTQDSIISEHYSYETKSDN